jgi:endonuclease/exonuclease/phosphatase family metal-dependent hydrolase
MTELSPATLRLATYNAHRVFDSDDDFEKNDGRPKSERSLEAVARVLSDSGADVVALQEIENEEMLKDIQGRGDLLHKFPHCVLVEGDDLKGIDVALMSRYPITHFESHTGESATSERKFQRPLLEINVQLPGQSTLTVFAGHFVAQFNDWCDQQRVWEASETARLTSLKLSEDPSGYVAVMGDFNDQEGSPVLRTLCEPSMQNATEGLPPSWGEVWSTQYEPALLDHILSSSSLSKLFVDSGVLHHPEDCWASDHRLVWADFKLPVQNGRIETCQGPRQFHAKTAS